jgi:serine/threonine-protein kinase RsbW
MAEYKFSYPSEMTSEERMFDDLHKVLKQSILDQKLHQKILLAISEAFSNALSHGNGFDPRKKIYLTVTVNDSMLCADITDEGQGGLDRIAVRCAPTALSEGGRGVDLMNHCAAKVDFSNTESGGLCVSLRFTIGY